MRRIDIRIHLSDKPQMGTLNPEEQVRNWSAETKEATLLACEAHYQSDKLPHYPWFLTKAKSSKVQGVLAELMYRAEMNSRQFSLLVGEYLGSLSTEMLNCQAALAIAKSEILSIETELRKLKPNSEEPSAVAVTLQTKGYTFALLSRGETFSQSPFIPVTVELDLDDLTLLVHEDQLEERICPKEVLRRLNIEKLLMPGVSLERRVLLKSGQVCDFILVFQLNDEDKGVVFQAQQHELETLEAETTAKMSSLEGERTEMMKALGINEEPKANRPEDSRGCDRCSIL